MHISRIRAAIEDDPKKPRRVITVRGAGYVFAKAQRLRVAMPRLYQKIYLTILASLLLVVLVAGAFWRLGASNAPVGAGVRNGRRDGDGGAAAGRRAAACSSRRRSSISRGASTPTSRCSTATCAPIAACRAADAARLGAATGRLDPRAGRSGLAHSAARRALAVVRPRAIPRRHPAFGMVLFLGAIALAVALAAYPVVRGLTRRIERLQAGVETLGAGDLSARAKVEGRDEVARLAESFNRAAARIEELVGAHRLLLANASHELRTPLSRIRLGLELFEQTHDEKDKAQLRARHRRTGFA